MDMKEIKKGYKKLGLTEEDMPQYKDPKSFSKRFERCSILEEVDIEYSNNTSGTNFLENKRLSNNL